MSAGTFEYFVERPGGLVLVGLICLGGSLCFWPSLPPILLLNLLPSGIKNDSLHCCLKEYFGLKKFSYVLDSEIENLHSVSFHRTKFVFWVPVEAQQITFVTGPRFQCKHTPRSRLAKGFTNCVTMLEITVSAVFTLSFVIMDTLN